MTAAGKHRDEPSAAAERYGKHSQAHAHGSSVPELLRRIIRRGEAFRLAWPDAETNAVVDREDFPTAVLPVVPAATQHGDATEPTTATRQARQWFGPDGLVRWPLAG